MEVAADVYRLKVPIPNNPLGYVNSYLVKTDSGSLLIDTGWNTDESYQSLTDQIAETGTGLDDLRYIVVTHAHPDHYGLAGRLAPHTSAELVMHEIESGFVNSRYVDYQNLVEEMNQWLRINGVPDSDRPQMSRASLPMLGVVAVAMPNHLVCGGEDLQLGPFDFEIIWTPGHSPGHICLFERERRLLFSGDHVLPSITPSVGMHTQAISNPLADYLDSLAAVKNLPVDLVLPGHGDPFTDLAGRVDEILAHHEKRKQEIVDAFAGQSRTAYDIAGRISWNTKGVPWNELPPFTRRMAVTETLAHLELLRAEGKLARIVHNGVVHYAVR